MINNDQQSLSSRLKRLSCHALMLTCVLVCPSACTSACAAVAGMKLMSLSRRSQLERFQQRSQRSRKDPWSRRAKVRKEDTKVKRLTPSMLPTRRRPIATAAAKAQVVWLGCRGGSKKCAQFTPNVMTVTTYVLKGLGVRVSSCMFMPSPKPSQDSADCSKSSSTSRSSSPEAKQCSSAPTLHLLRIAQFCAIMFW